jgi:hypothetical protein
MIRTRELIDLLGSELKPTRRLRSPVFRTVYWVMVAAAVVALLSVGQGLRADLPLRLADRGFAIGLAAAAITAVCAALASFNLAIPGRARLWLLLPLPPLGVWLGSIGGQCLTHWVRYDAGRMAMDDTARCFATLVLTSLPLWLLMLVMLRRARPIHEVLTMLTGSLAVAATAATAMDLLHDLDASIMILLWNFGLGAVIVLLSALFSRPLLSVGPPLRQ